jgi:hypothetical protein
MNTLSGGLPSAEAFDKESAHRQTGSRVSVLAAVGGFLRTYWRRILIISAAVTIPCFWHRRIEAGDLPSHVYNAWLAQLIERGRAPGLWLAHPWTNVLFDVALEKLGNLVGLGAAQKILVPASVLVFFWGAFALVCAISRPAGPSPSGAKPAATGPARPASLPWSLLPCLAMFSYGWTFEMGFMNFYLSIGLAFFALAILHGGTGRQRALAALFIPLIALAHPLGLVLLAGAGAYLLLAERLPPRHQGYLLLASAAVMACLSIFLARHYSARWRFTAGTLFPGMDQLLLFGLPYKIAYGVLEAFFVVCLVADLLRGRRSRKWWLPYLLPAQLYASAILASVLLPSLIVYSKQAAPLSYLTDRLTSVSAIFLCCLLGAMQPRKWHLAGFAAVGVLFFSFLYSDTATLNRMEGQAEDLVRALPPGQRVVAELWPLAGSRISFVIHIVDRACIGRCFSYGNYEPASTQFRVRARPGNSIVTASRTDSDYIANGNYVVKPRDLPMVEITQCGDDLTVLCARRLRAGDSTGCVGDNPAP